MITRIDRLGVALPPPSAGELSAFMNYTFQSFTFRGRPAARPFFDLVANIAAEELGHIELVAGAINTMLTDPAQVDAQAPDATGGYVSSSGDLVDDLTHDLFLETGAHTDHHEVSAVFDGPHPETGEDLVVRDGPLPNDLPPQAGVLAAARETRDEAVDGFEFLTMAEAGEAGHWLVGAKLNQRAGLPRVAALADGAPAVRQRHLQEVLDGSVPLAGGVDPEEPEA
ncbi:manganese catalase family protein [Baekduia soli]|uniref:manganese catalase family protein n=1 Tax=Baekduia soli TaxID=496014 RepID=UPI001E5F0E32|nr:manganese catalase family protein [Baekduia soli]